MPIESWRGTWRGQSPAGLTHQRSRQIISPSGGIVRGKFPSRKTGRMVQHEGLLELDAIYLFETSPLIVSYREQPMTLMYPDGAKLRRYTPDFELTLVTGEVVLIEVKPRRNLQDPEIRHKLNRVEEHLGRSGQRFAILDDEQLRREPRQSALRRIYHLAPRRLPSVCACRSARDLQAGLFPLSLKGAEECFAERSIDPYSMLLHGLITCALDAPTTKDTLLHMTREDSHAWFFIAEGHGF